MGLNYSEAVGFTLASLWAVIFIVGSIWNWLESAKQIAENPENKGRINEIAGWIYLGLACLPMTLTFLLILLCIFIFERANKKLQDWYVNKLKNKSEDL